MFRAAYKRITRLGGVLDASSMRLGTPWSHLEAFLGHLGTSWRRLEASWMRLGRVLEAS